STFSPTSSQVKSYLFRYMLSIPQLSVDPASTSCAPIEIWPLLLRVIVTLLQSTNVRMVSFSCTIAEHCATAPKLSVTRTLTFCSPTSVQVYLDLLNSLFTIDPSGSKLELTQ